MSPSAAEVVVHADRDALASAAAARLVTAVQDALARRGTAGVVLTGGTVGTAMLAALAASPAASTVDWSAVDVWWGDERYVAAGDPERNETQARDALLGVLAGLGQPPERVHAMPASDGPDGDDPALAADRYGAELARVARAQGVAGPVPVLDVLLLGVGPDGHVASLFPHHPSLAEGEKAGASVIAVHDSPKPPPTRLSLTLPVINGAEEVWCVVSGDDKADAVAQALTGPGDLPASRVSGMSRTLWLIDEAAASKR